MTDTCHRSFQQMTQDLPPREWKSIQKAFFHLFDTTRSFLDSVEMVDLEDDDECLVNTDNVHDLQAAVREVYRVMHGNRGQK